jgi:hypothetical protein
VNRTHELHHTVLSQPSTLVPYMKGMGARRLDEYSGRTVNE